MRSEPGQDPLLRAAMDGSWNLVEVLLRHGADAAVPFMYAGEQESSGLLKLSVLARVRGFPDVMALLKHMHSAGEFSSKQGQEEKKQEEHSG